MYLFDIIVDGKIGSFLYCSDLKVNKLLIWSVVNLNIFLREVNIK